MVKRLRVQQGWKSIVPPPTLKGYYIVEIVVNVGANGEHYWIF